MKTLLRALLIFMFSLMLTGCAGASDYKVSLPNGYSILRSSAHMVTLNKQRNNSTLDEPLIPAKVVEAGWDNQYILVKQLGLKKKNPDNPNDTYEIPDDKIQRYYIVEMKTQKVYGPLNEESFKETRKKLNISDSIILKSVDSLNKS